MKTMRNFFLRIVATVAIASFSLDDEALGFKFDAQGRVVKYGVTPN
jgi:hypothetical protein